MKQRLDRWLWHARFFKTRTLASERVTGGHIRVNSTKVSKPATQVGADDVLTFAQGRQVRVVRIIALAERRGPAAEAQKLYEDMSPPAPPRPPRAADNRRPTKQNRRALDRLKDNS